MQERTHVIWGDRNGVRKVAIQLKAKIAIRVESCEVTQQQLELGNKGIFQGADRPASFLISF
jgi:hypothetical protein